MAAPTIPNGEEHFFPIIYEGNGAGRRVGKFVPFTDNGTIDNSVIFNDADNAYLSRTNDAGDRTRVTISVWVKRCALGAVQHIFDTYDGSSTNDGYIRFNADNTMSIRLGSPSNMLYTTRMSFADTSKWFHIMLAVNTNDSTASSRAKLYIDGTQISAFSTQTNAGSADDTQFNYSSATFRIGSTTGGTYDFDGYLAEFNQVDGQQLTPDTFGVTDTSTGRWIPKTLSGITYGTNGFRLKFQDSSALGDDTSGNTNDFSATNLASTDQTTDSPSQNFPTFDSNQTIDNAGGTNIFSEGNLRVDMDYGGSGNQYGMALMNPAYAVTSGKYYWEHKLISQSHTNPSIYNLSMPGIIDLNVDKDITSYIGHTSGPTTYSWYTLGGFVFCDGTYDTQAYLPGGSTLPAIGDIINFALDMDNGAWYIGVNGTYVTGADGSVGNPASGSARTGAVRTFAPNTRKYIYGTSTQSGFNCVDEVNFGQKSFIHSIPTGYTKWQQDNVPSTDRNIPDMCWVKNRDSGSWYHTIIDSSRGPLLEIYPNGAFDEAAQANSLRKFLKGGYQCGEAGNWNLSGSRMVSWNWRANGGTTSANNNGSISSVVQANQTAGFSIVQFTGTGANATVGHGLSSAPEWIVCRNLEDTASWAVYHKDMSSAAYTLFLDTNAAQTSTSTMWNSTAPTSSVINVGANYASNGSSQKMVHYCWHSVDGFSKFGKYSGNNSTDGPFVYTGFTPSFIIVKKRNATADWTMQDTTRYFNNPNDRVLQPNLTDAEVTGYLAIDFLSNGFKFRSTDNQHNASGGTYVYMAFAEHPFVGDGTSPVTAR